MIDCRFGTIEPLQMREPCREVEAMRLGGLQEVLYIVRCVFSCVLVGRDA
jgi:hypothetical protein